MRQADIGLLYEYNYWANQRILAAAAKLSNEQFIAPTGFPRGNLRGTLLHVLDAEYGWRFLLTEGREVDDLAQADFPTLAALEVRWREEEAAMRAYLDGLTDEKITGIVRYTNMHGVKRERVLWHALFHVVNHGTQHRSEAAAMLTDYDLSPGDVDFTFFLAETLQHSG